ncbi:ATP-binding protein [Candidatus Woesebacteria bacterium]|nr:ATP-binding protein [Candidatus Woesebacteria bacterium]
MDIAQLEQLLVRQNPHWKGESDFGVSLSTKRSIYEEIENNLKNTLILAIKGIRRIGKSYLLKQLLSEHLLKQEIPPKNLLYFQFATSFNEKNFIIDLLNLYLTKYAVRSKPILILFDEVQYIDYWQDQVKFFYDQEKNIKFVVTGSTSLFYRQKSKETLAGRIIKISLGSLTFQEYLNFKGLKKETKSDIENIDRVSFINNLHLYQSEFKNYLAFGQFPELAIKGTNLNPKDYLDNLTDQLINYDIPYFRQTIDRVTFLNLVKSLSFSIANEYSLNKLAKDLESERRILSDYVKVLEEISLFSSCLNAYFKSIRQKLSSIKKIYTLNTNISLNINGFGESYLNDNRVFGQYFENYAYMRIKNLFKEVEYYQSKNKELDFVSKDYAFEVKSGPIKNQKKYIDLAKRLKKKLVFISENELEEQKDFIKVPIYLL